EMSFLGKLRNAVLGNTVLRDYELGKQIASAGPGLLWKVHAGVKKSNRQEVAIFVFNKQTPEFEKLSKKHRDTLVETLKRGPTQLAKLRHPKLLTIDHPVEDSADSMAFATEPISACLANILGHHGNLPSPIPSTVKEYELHPIEIQYGLLEIAEALAFLHDSVHMLHGNLSPESIVLAKAGSWKLMGFEFSSYTQPQGDTLSVPEPSEWDSRSHPQANPRLEYLAPEYVINRARCEASDFYSYGMTIYACYNGGRSLFDCQNNVTAFKQNAEQISRMTEAALGNIPAEFKTLVRSTLSIDPSVRPDNQLIVKHPFFEEVGANTLKYLDTLVEKGDMEKSQFFKKSLSRVITKLPKRVINQRVLPALAGEFKNNKMIPFLLPLLFLLAEDYSSQEYTNLLWPVLVPVFLVQDPVQVPIILLQRMDLLLKKTPQEDIKKHVIPMILRAMEGGGATANIQLQELCVSVLPTFAGMMDYSSLKHSIIPRLVTTCESESTSLGLLVKCLVTIGKMLDHFDKLILVDQVIPMLEKIKSREPAVLMAMLGIYTETLKNKKLGLDKNLLGTRIVPFLIPLAMEPALKLSQFNQFMIVVEEMLYKVVTEQRSHLEQLAAMEQQTESTVAFAQEVSEAKAMDDALDKMSGGVSSKPQAPQGTTSTPSNIGPLEVDDFFSLHETTLTRPQAQVSTSSVSKLSTQSPSIQRSVAPSFLQPSPSLLQPSPSLLQPSPSLLQPSPSLLQPSQTSSSVGQTEAFDADFGPVEWSSANQQQQLGGGGRGGGAQQWSNVGTPRPASSSGQYVQVGEGPSSSGSGQANTGQLFSGMESRPLPLAGGWSGQTSSSNQLSSVPQTGQMYVQTTGVRGGQQMESQQQQPALRPGSTAKLEPSVRQQVSSGFGQPLVPVPVQNSTPQQQAQVTNPPMGWSSGVSVQNSTPQQQAQVTNPPMGWSSGVSVQNSTPQQQAQVTNPPMGWSSGVSAQNSTPQQQAQVTNTPMGWSSGVSAQNSTPQQQAQVTNTPMGWSSGVSAQNSTPQQQAQVTNPPMGWSGPVQQNNSLAWSSQTQVIPSAQSQQWPTLAAVQRPSTRDNPFADFLA
ncbi:hypothetical protein EMCRGX_G008642, partial [Ephydatia muelleri]